MSKKRLLTPFYRSGGVTVWALLSLSALIGIMALTLDGGRVFEERRHAQGAADAAALAAGAEMYLSAVNKTTSNLNTVVLNTAARYGYTGNGVDSTVTVNRPPGSGPFAGDSDFVEVVIRANLDSTFGQFFTRQKMAVEGRAVARGRPATVGVVVLHPSASNAFHVSGNGSFRVSNTRIRVNSTSHNAFHVGDNATVSAESHHVVGGIQKSWGSNVTGTRYTGVPPTWDPLAWLPAPDPAASTTRATAKLTLSGSEPVTLWPGIYERGIDFECDATVTMMPGVYIIGSGGVYFGGTGSVVGNGVMIYNSSLNGAGASIQASGNGPVRLDSPQSGTYMGISIFQERGLTSPIDMTGKGNLEIDGLIYANAAHVKVTGNAVFSRDYPAAGIIARTIQVGGNGRVRIDPARAPRPRIPDVGLVE